ncbi:hypothetical protein SNEBB_009548 [Seison nebaliae]|nr:hypothetical protein SNEBB_009548 [Seison nebaliae]
MVFVRRVLRRFLSSFPRLTPNEATSIIRRNERNVDVNNVFVQGFEANQLASNKPCEDRAVVSQLHTVLNGEAIATVVTDGHGGALCAESVTQRLIDYVAVSLLPSKQLAEYVDLDGKVERTLHSPLYWSSAPLDVPSIDRYHQLGLLSLAYALLNDINHRPDMLSNIERAIRLAFIFLDDHLSQEARRDRHALSVVLSGACTCLILLMPQANLYVAHSGDVCALMGGSSSSDGNIVGNKSNKNVDDKSSTNNNQSTIVNQQSNKSSMQTTTTTTTTTTTPTSNIVHNFADKNRTIISNDSVVHQLTIEHNAENLDEVHRIEQAHPISETANLLKGGRLLGHLLPLRAFGDARFKWSAKDIHQHLTSSLGTDEYQLQHYHSPPYLTAEPEVRHYKLTAHDSFIVIASDGLWEQLSFTAVAQLVNAHMLGRQSFEPFNAVAGMSLDDLNSALTKRNRALTHQPEDRNVATHIIRHALAGTDRGLDHIRLAQLLSYEEPRSIRDDITLCVIHLDTDAIIEST